MFKKGSWLIKSTSLSEIFILIVATFAIAVIIAETNQASANIVLNGVPVPDQPIPVSNVPTDTASADVFGKNFGLPPEAPAAGGSGPGGIEELLKKLLTGEDGGAFGPEYAGLGHLATALIWAGIAGVATYAIVKFAGGSVNAARAAGLAVALGTGIARFGFLQASFVEGGGQTFAGEFFKAIGFGGGGGGAFLWGVGITAVVFVLLYKEEKKKIVTLQCLPWEAPLGGADCERCNQDPLKPCSEYRCKSLGQACDLVNKGTTEERCVWVARGDVTSPVITPWKDVLTKDHTYTDIRGRPPSRGTQIKYASSSDGCIKPFTALEFGLTTNEPSQCKIDTIGNKTFDDMQFYFGESNLFRYNHTEQLRLPSPDALKAESPELPQEGIYNFYVRCRDANGNVNEDEFVYNICVDKSPDASPPIIESTSITSGSPITFGTQNISLSLYVNEPADCKWSTQDKSFDLMEHAMSCSSHVYQLNAQQLYPCTSSLNGLKDRADNTFFFRCKDQPLKADKDRNVNQQSYSLVLRGTQPLSILSYGPNATFTGSTDVVAVNLTVKTDDGADEGKATCYFSPSGKEGDYVAMFNTDSFQHQQILSLPTGNYTFFFRCIDAGGNAAAANTTFSVLTDRAAPQITRVYKESDALKVITDEDSTCKYSLTDCNFVFDEGLSLILLNSKEPKIHATPWKPQQSYFVKCRDSFGNEPSPNACSIVVSASTAL